MPGHVYHITAATLDRTAWFSDFHVACEAVRAFRTPGVLGDATLLAWVLMPDHVHWLVEAGEDAPIEKVVAWMKSASAVHANRILARAGPLWYPAFHDRALRHEDDLRAVARYIVANPLRAGLVWKLCEPGDLLPEARRHAEVLAKRPISSLIAVKRTMTEPLRVGIAAARERENAAFAELMGGPANLEALTAFAEGREPDFSDL